MKLSSSKKSFQPRARLLLQLGDKLIRNENIALLELVKNSYDADARKVTITLTNTEIPKSGIIDVIDDGEGMDISIIEDVWLEPGSDYKEAKFKNNVRTPKFNRLPIGEKGIGRFGVHKLGYFIELISRKKDKNEVVVKIDWRKFGQKKYLKDSEFEVYENTEPEYFKGTRTGTRIRISDLRTVWDKRMIRDLYKSVFSLQSPFKRGGNFNIELKLSNQDLVADLPTLDDIRHFALFHFKCKLDSTKIFEFEYNFTPWKELYRIQPKTITQDDNIVIENETLLERIDGAKKEYRLINLQKNYADNDEEVRTIGPIEIEGYIFDRDKTILELYDYPGLSLLKEYLDEQGGVRVYREGLRINEYGEQGNDWLNLDSRRVNEPTRKISNNIILAVIDIKREHSKALEEKTNREGFIENEAFHDFRAAVLHVVQLIEKLREIDKSEIRSKYGQKEVAEPVIHHLGILKELVDEKVKDPGDNAEISRQIEKVEKDYIEIQNVLFTSAGAGLTLAIGLHEIEKVVSEANALIRREEIPGKIKQLIERIELLMNNYSTILKSDEKTENDVLELIDTALFNVEYRMLKHGIVLVPKFRESRKKLIGECSKKFLLGAIINVLDNSIHWLGVKDQRLKKSSSEFQKKIFIDVQEDSEYYNILIADNGTGFSIPTSQVTHAFITTKSYGMGLGLHIVYLLMKSQNGLVIFPDHRDFMIPEEFWGGALVCLKIKKIKYDSPK
jgi:Histidine kinase-, DNA gyrase B-, and HSP90-like ATPase